MKSLFIYTLLLIISVGFISCDSTTSPENPLSDSPTIESFDLSPLEVEFTLEEDGFKDTLVTISINSLISNLNTDQNPQYAISAKSTGETVLEGELSSSETQQYNFSTDANFPTTTTSIEDYIVNIFFENNPGVYAQTGFRIQGFSNNRPEILNTTGPNLINRPSSGEIPAVFTAKVTDADGQETIDQVYIRVINQESGEVEGSPFQMFDDGTTYTDTTANDSVYTWFQPVPPNESNPNRDFDIEFYAIDLAGLSSDTVRTTFRIR